MYVHLLYTVLAQYTAKDAAIDVLLAFGFLNQT